MMVFAILCVVLAFFLPLPFATSEDDGVWLGAMLAFLVFTGFQIGSHEETEIPVDRSEIDYAVTQVDGERTLFVKHSKDEFRTDKATLVENIEDTTQVEIVLERSESVWFGPSHYLRVRSK